MVEPDQGQLPDVRYEKVKKWRRCEYEEGEGDDPRPSMLVRVRARDSADQDARDRAYRRDEPYLGVVRSDVQREQRQGGVLGHRRGRDGQCGYGPKHQEKATRCPIAGIHRAGWRPSILIDVLCVRSPSLWALAKRTAAHRASSMHRASYGTATPPGPGVDDADTVKLPAARVAVAPHVGPHGRATGNRSPPSAWTRENGHGSADSWEKDTRTARMKRPRASSSTESTCRTMGLDDDKKGFMR